MISATESFGRQQSRRWWRKCLSFVGVGLLWLSVLVSALAVVNVTQQARKRVNELELLRTEHAELKVANGQYLLEQSAWSAYSRIENLAVNKLHMKVPAVSDVVVVGQ